MHRKIEKQILVIVTKYWDGRDYSVSETKSGHISLKMWLMVRAECHTRVVVFPSTPSDWRSMKNAESYVKNYAKQLISLSC